MDDFFEIDFLDVETEKSGDAIAIRYSLNGRTRIHVTDGGFVGTGPTLVGHIREYYGNPSRIDSVVITHPDGDHAGGVRSLFEAFTIGELWMLRPWMYAAELLPRFARYQSAENLAAHLRTVYPHIARLEELAQQYQVPILAPFQGVRVGEFRVLAPTQSRYLDLIVESDKTPAARAAMSFSNVSRFVQNAISYVRSAWGDEVFPVDDTSAENNMSVVQYANLCGKKVLLTADAGRAALLEAADFAPFVGLALPGIDRIQVPHHGSRHNVSTEVLDRWLGPRLPVLKENCTAIVSAAHADPDHPRNAVVRAFIHRGAKVISTESGTKRTAFRAPDRAGWVGVPSIPYPDTQEEE